MIPSTGSSFLLIITEKRVPVQEDRTFSRESQTVLRAGFERFIGRETHGGILSTGVSKIMHASCNSVCMMNFVYV